MVIFKFYNCSKSVKIYSFPQFIGQENMWAHDTIYSKKEFPSYDVLLLLKENKVVILTHFYVYMIGTNLYAKLARCSLIIIDFILSLGIIQSIVKE